MIKRFLNDLFFKFGYVPNSTANMMPRITNSEKYEIQKLQNVQFLSRHDMMMLGPQKTREFYDKMKLDLIAEADAFIECRQREVTNDGYDLTVSMYVAHKVK